MADDEREIIQGLCSRETEGPTTILFSLEGGDTKCSVIGRRAYRSRSGVNMDYFSQLLRGSASDDLITKTRSLAFDALFYGEPVQLFKKRFAVFCSTRLKNELGSRVLYFFRL